MAIWHQLEPAISGLTLSTLLPAVAILCVCGAASVVFYRLFLHPLSRFPGPRIAAATGWYHTYYDIWKGGKMTQNIAKLHEIYGPIVRIGPNGIHFSDPTAYSTIYSVNSKFLKDPVVYSAFSAQESSFGFVDPHAARGRRTVLNPLFSRRAAIDMQWLVVEKFEKLCQRLGEPNDSGKPINLLWAFRSTTIDIISAFCFANSLDALDVKGFNSPLLVTFNAAAGAFKITKNFPLIAAFLRNSPPWFTKLMSTEIAAIQEVVSVLGRQIDSLMANPEELKNAPHPIIYNRLLDDTIKGASAAPPTRKSLLEEAQVLLFAGSDTVGLTLTNGVFHVLDNPAVHQKLMEELTTAWPNLGTAPGYEDLEKLPYLTAVIKESLRVAHGVVSQLPRITPSPGVVISGEHIPAGTVVMMSAPIVHANEEIFPDSQTFIPERWQQPNSQHLDNYLVTFSKGSRQCLGINLAYCELYVGFANIFRRCEIQPTTTKENLDWVDNFVAHYPGGGLEGFVKLRAS